MPTNNDKETKPKTLREKTQSLRGKARQILRMELINEFLQRIFHVNEKINTAKKEIEYLTNEETDAEKIVARAEYKVRKLDQEDPDFETKKENGTKFIETEKERQKKILESITKSIEYMEDKIKEYNKEMENLNEEIEKIESGKTKVSVNKMNDLTNSLIKNS